MSVISFVIPCYRSSKTIQSVLVEIQATMENVQQYEYEVILINDSSPDDTFEIIREICEANPRVKGINLARNFGQHAALMAGFRSAEGEIVVCLDDDGQTPANQAIDLIKKIEEGNDVVYAKYNIKKHSGFRNFGSLVNEKMAQILIGKPKDLYISSYFAARRFIIDEIMEYKNPYPYVIGLVLRTTNKIANVEVNHREREIGASGYTFKKLITLWFNGFTAFSVKPLRIATFVGIGCSIIGFLYFIYVVINKIINPGVPAGWSSMISALMVIGGLILFMLGLIGEYVGRIYISLNNAPQYVIREAININYKEVVEGNDHE